MMRLLPYGDRAVLVEVDGRPAALRAALNGHPGLEELVPAARTLLVRFDPGRIDRASVQAAIETAATAATAAPSAPGSGAAGAAHVTLPVHYDGLDLAAVAEIAACSIDEVVSRHCAGRYEVAFCGFAPGFAYLTGLDPRLHVPRLDAPRTEVRAGSVGIAGEYTAAYPRPSPGGWRLIGRTQATLWDLARPDPALLTPGTQVRFEAAR